MKVICQDRRSRIAPTGPQNRTNSQVSADVDNLLGPKNLGELKGLESQINKKLQSNEPIDVEYWEQLLSSIRVYKAKAELKNIYKAVIDSRLKGLKEQQIAEAELVQERLWILSAVTNDGLAVTAESAETQRASQISRLAKVNYSRALDPEPLLKVRLEDKSLEVIGEAEFLSNVVSVICLSKPSLNAEVLLGFGP